MNRGESIALANELGLEYRAVKEIQKKIDENETLLSEYNEAKPEHRRLISFFWRYLLIAGIVFIVMLVPTIVLSLVIFFIAFESKLPAVYPQIAIAILFIINVAVPVLIIVCGYRKAKRKMRDFNLKDEEKAAYNKKRKDELMRQTDEFRMQKNARLESLRKYDDLIPESLREGETMETLRRLLVAGKAETFSDAIELLNTKKSKTIESQQEDKT